MVETGLVDDSEISGFLIDAQYKPSEYHDSSRPNWRKDKTKCPNHIGAAEAEQLLRAGFQRRLFSAHRRGRWPQTVWAIDDDGIVYEAQLTNQGSGEYHGYPMKENDRFTDTIVSQWRERQ